MPTTGEGVVFCREAALDKEVVPAPPAVKNSGVASVFGALKPIGTVLALLPPPGLAY